MYSLPSISQIRLPTPFEKAMVGSAFLFKETTPPGIHFSFLFKSSFDLGQLFISFTIIFSLENFYINQNSEFLTTRPLSRPTHARRYLVQYKQLLHTHPPSASFC